MFRRGLPSINDYREFAVIRLDSGICLISSSSHRITIVFCVYNVGKKKLVILFVEYEVDNI